MKKINPALVISTLALVVATTGTGIAATKINGRDIKDRSIPASKLMLKSITPKQIKPRSLTRATLAATLADSVSTDPVTGATGPAGPAGPAGLIDPAKLIAVAGADVSLNASTNANVSAACPAGTFLIGGGYSDMGTAQKVYAVSSGPASDGSQAWTVHARNDDASLNQSQPWHAIAYCVVSP